MSQEQKFIQKSPSQKKSFSELFEFSTLQYYTLPSIYILVFTISKLHQNYWIGIWIVYTLIPLCDEMFPIDLKNPTPEEQTKLEGQLKFKLPLYTCIFLDWFNLFYTLNYLLTGPEITFLNLFAFLVLNGNLAASNINISHELIHKDDILDQIMGTITLWRNMYLHFAIEHIYGHHKHVATPNDPASSRRGQSVYQFLPQTVVGSYASAWKIENSRCLLKYKTEYCLQNMMIWYTASYFILPLVFLYYYGLVGMSYFLLTVFNGILYLEIVNYIEHYGLSRKEISPGVYEQVNITHSWNAPHRISNYLLFKLQRHSDHHENAYKPYQTLCTFEKSPQLPHGYTVCIIAALNPKLWMSIMDESIESYQKNGKYVYNEKVQKQILGFIFKIGIVTTSITAFGFL
ncbi:hypothetical protein pb186bvf_013880 [Paramecium bursaria]